MRYVVHHVPSSLQHAPPPAAAEPVDGTEGIFAVTVNKATASQPLGLRMCSTKPKNGKLFGVQVETDMTSGSPFHGLLRKDDWIISVNGRPALGATATSELLKEAVGDIILICVRSASSSPVRHILVTTKGVESLGIKLHHLKSVENMMPYVGDMNSDSILRPAGLHIGHTLLAVSGQPVVGGSHAATMVLKERMREGEVRRPARVGPTARGLCMCM